MLEQVLLIELESKAGRAVAEKHAGRIEKALAILDECEAIIKRIKAMNVPKLPTVADTFKLNDKQNEGTNTNG